LPRLRELLGAEAVSFVVREFVQGELALVAQPVDTGLASAGVLCETSPQGLPALIGGIAPVQALAIDHRLRVVAEGRPGLNQPQARQLRDVTLAAAARLGPLQLDWVLHQGRLRLIDSTSVSRPHRPALRGDLRVLSPGYAQGMPLPVPASAELDETSLAASMSAQALPDAAQMGPLVLELARQIEARHEPIIVIAPRPCAALAALIPWAAGFVFEQASQLCRLSVLLRQYGRPAVASPALYRRGLAGRRVVIDARTNPAEDPICPDTLATEPSLKEPA